MKVEKKKKLNKAIRIWSFETHRGISGREKDRKRRRKIDVLVAEGDKDTPTSAAYLSVEDWVKNWIIALNILRGGGRRRKDR